MEKAAFAGCAAIGAALGPAPGMRDTVQTKKRALLLVHRIPYPPDKGDKIRSWRLLDYLSKRFDLSLACFVDDPADRQHQPFLQKFCTASYFEPLSPLRAKIKSLTGYFTDEPLTYPYYRSAKMRNWIRAQTQAQPFDVAIAFSSSMAPYLWKEGVAHVTLTDMVDVDSEKWRDYASHRGFPLKQVYAREAGLLAREEGAITHKSDATFLISPQEASLLNARPGTNSKKVHWWGNGVDTDYFTPAYKADPITEQPDIIFTGAMDYWANEQAVLWFLEAVWPSLKARYPSLQFAIVGSNPGEMITRWHGKEGVIVTGRVGDIRPWLAAAKISVAPMKIARGVQNKVLEAMAMGKPVVATMAAATGLTEAAIDSLCIADSAAEQIAALIDLLDQSAMRQTMGTRTRAVVSREYSWEGQLQRFGKILRAHHLLNEEEGLTD